MKRNFLIESMVILVLFAAFGSAFAQQANAARSTGASGGSQPGGWICPWCGTAQGQCLGPGMLLRGWCRSGATAIQMTAAQGGPGETVLTEAQARQLLASYLKSSNNPNVKFGKITDEPGTDYYLATITTRDGTLVDKIEIDKHTGWFRSAYAR